ncbi:ATP-binding protein [Streptomyces sodiiphilus]
MMTQPVYCPEDWEVSLHLQSDAHAPRLCRRTAVHAVREYGLPYLADAAALLTSELATNAVRHGKGPLAYRVAWYAGRGRLRLTVWDEGEGRAPVNPSPPPGLPECGRGLLIVAVIAEDWGQHSTPGGGKALWAELGVPQSPP